MTETGTQQLYEGMYILSATLSEEARRKALERIEMSITERAGQLHKVHDQGRKKLAYEIDRKRDGYYFLIYFSIAPSEITELWKEYHLNEDLVRFITLRAEEVKETLEFPVIIEEGAKLKYER